MSTNLIIALTIAFAVIANTRIVVGRSVSMLPTEMLKDLDSEPAVSNRMVNYYSDHLLHFPFIFIVMADLLSHLYVKRKKKRMNDICIQILCFKLCTRAVI